MTTFLEIKEEWLNHGFWIGNSIDKDLIPEEVMNKMADWWLIKFSDHIEEVRKEIEKIIEESWNDEMKIKKILALSTLQIEGETNSDVPEKAKYTTVQCPKCFHIHPMIDKK